MTKNNDEHTIKSSRFFNRELSWLAFNHRVLEEAENPNNPLLERIRFLAISDRNLDEFYMVRVAGLMGQVEAGLSKRSPDGLTPHKQLALVNHQARQMMTHQSDVWAAVSKPLEEEGIRVTQVASLPQSKLKQLKEQFLTGIFPALTPLAVDPAHPFPFITNDGLAIVLKLFDPKENTLQWAIVPLPRTLDRFIAVKDQPGQFVLLEDVVLQFVALLFPRFEVRDSGLFHIIRDSEMELDEEADNLIEMFKLAIRERHRGSIIRLMVNEAMSPEMTGFIQEQMESEDSDVFKVSGLMNLEDLKELVELNRPELKFPAFSPRVPEPIKKIGGNIFEAIRHRGAIVVHHPYESFDVVVDFLDQAASDPNVLAIKQTLYRTSKRSPIVRALIEAAESGKSVTAVIELKARFDEADNIRQAEMMERAGVHVVYGFMDRKTHSKLSLVVRRQSSHHGQQIQNFVHFGTGNYHPITARRYTDLSLFTCDPVLARDAAKVFNFLTGYAFPDHLEKLIISPDLMQQNLLALIKREMMFAENGQPASIWAKMNSLVDPKIIDALYKASQVGVKIRLIVRGICCLKPGIAGLSENIEVVSIVGRYLEHARVVCFGNGAEMPSEQTLVYISSADWMPRNFHSRVETLVPVENTVVKQLVLDVMTANLNDNTQSWWLDAEGEYHRLSPKDGESSFGVHQHFMGEF